MPLRLPLGQPHLYRMITTTVSARMKYTVKPVCCCIGRSYNRLSRDHGVWTCPLGIRGAQALQLASGWNETPRAAYACTPCRVLKLWKFFVLTRCNWPRHGLQVGPREANFLEARVSAAFRHCDPIKGGVMRMVRASGSTLFLHCST